VAGEGMEREAAQSVQSLGPNHLWHLGAKYHEVFAGCRRGDLLSALLRIEQEGTEETEGLPKDLIATVRLCHLAGSPKPSF